MPAPKNGARTRIGKRMRRIREARGIKAPQLAEKLGVRAQAIYGWERGKYSPSLLTLHNLLNEIECWYIDLLQPIDAPIPPRRRPKLNREDPEGSC